MSKKDWTISTLKEHFERVLKQRDKATTIALAAAKEAVTVAEKNAEKWRDNANEWRGAMNDREKNFLSKAEFTSYKESMDKALIIEKERADKNEGKGIGYGQLIASLLVAAGIVIAAIGLMIKKG